MGSAVVYPYLPKGREIQYVPKDNLFMKLARAYAEAQSFDLAMPSAAVVVDGDGYVVGLGANGSDYHQKYTCRRMELKCKTGQGYDLCEGCHPKNHSEAKAISSVRRKRR